MKKIIFTNTLEFKDLDLPKPASRYVPEWYKNTSSYAEYEKKPFDDGTSPSTIKKCIPVFDAITAGYIIESPADVYVSLKDVEQDSEEFGESPINSGLTKTQYFNWSAFHLIDFHPIIQAPYHPSRNNFSYPKWNNPWGIKTPKGYSCMFVQPMHRESVFTILPGIVDTDTYNPPVNFPFVINDPNFEGLIPKGTPIAQVIPFKRDSWKSYSGNDEDALEILQNRIKLSTKFFDKYKTMFWEKKEYT